MYVSYHWYCDDVFPSLPVTQAKKSVASFRIKMKSKSLNKTYKTLYELSPVYPFNLSPSILSLIAYTSATLTSLSSGGILLFSVLGFYTQVCLSSEMLFTWLPLFNIQSPAVPSLTARGNDQSCPSCLWHFYSSILT